jgi:hypothetical protein
MTDIVMKFDGIELTLELPDGRVIAKRGEPGTKDARKWVSMMPGVIVRDRWRKNGKQYLEIVWASGGAGIQ